MKGTLVNTATVIVGSLLGLGIGSRLKENIKKIVMYGIGLATLLIGFTLAFKTQNVMIVIGSLAIGGIVGELLKLEEKLNQLGEYIQKKVKSQSGNFVLGFVTASMVFCVGPMTILGSINDGISGDASLLYAKSVLDGFGAIVFSATMGIGVIFSTIVIFIYQGLLTLLGSQLSFLLDEKVINEFTATGGLIIVGIGLYLLEIKKLKLVNFLPALVVAVILALIFT